MRLKASGSHPISPLEERRVRFLVMSLRNGLNSGSTVDSPSTT